MSGFIARLSRIPRLWRITIALLMVTLILASTGWWQGTAVGPQVQVPMFYDDHYVFPRPWTQEQEAPGVPNPAPISALFGSNRISQTFFSGMNHLSMLAIWLAGPPGTPVQVSMVSEDGMIHSGEIVLDEEAGRPYYLSFQPIRDSRGRAFTITLAAPEATRDRPVTTRAVGGDRLGKSVSLNEYPQPGNLELYTYGKGIVGRWWLEALGEQILPDTFALRVQQYKPEPFKGAVFAGLVGATFILSTLLLVLSRPAGISVGAIVSVALIAFLGWQLLSGRLRLPYQTSIVPLQMGGIVIPSSPGPDQSARLVRDLPLTLWASGREPEAMFFETYIDEMGHSVIRAPAKSSLEYPLVVPVGGRFRVGLGLTGPGAIRFIIRLDGHELHDEVVDSPEDTVWLELDLSDWSGQSQTLVLETENYGGSEEVSALWIMPQVEAEPSWLLPYPPPASESAELVANNFAPPSAAGLVELLAYETSPLKVEPGGEVEIALYWHALENTDAYATVFVHLLDETGQILAQHDGQPVLGTYPTVAWQGDTVVVDRHRLRLPPDTPAGEYTVALGLYDPATSIRWRVTSGDKSTEDGQVVLERAVLVGSGS